MTLQEQYAVLILAEKITLGEQFTEGMLVTVSGGQQVKATAAIIEAAARIALERHKQGFAGPA